MESHAPNLTARPPILISELKDLMLGVRDLEYDAVNGLLFVAMSDMSVLSRLDKTITNSTTWAHSDKTRETILSIGSLVCFAKKDSQNLEFVKLWRKPFTKQVIFYRR